MVAESTRTIGRSAPGALGAAASSGYARYIGRVGALAVALGVGAAVATGQGLGLGVAHADETSSADGSSTGASADPGPATGKPADVGVTSPSTQPPAGGKDDEPAENPKTNAHVPDMNYSGGVPT